MYVLYDNINSDKIILTMLMTMYERLSLTRFILSFINMICVIVSYGLDAIHVSVFGVHVCFRAS